MAAYPRTPQRRPLDETHTLRDAGRERSFDADGTRTLAPAAQPVMGRHIPRFFVLVPSDDDQASIAASTGAHRFPTRPTPVLKAAIGMMGYRNLQAACRPWGNGRGAYRCARINRDGSGQQVRSLASARFPKV